MLDPIEAFERQFTPTDGGYLYYPSQKSGGKLVTAEEFDELSQSWKRVAGRSGILKAIALILLIIVLWTVAGSFFSLPKWIEKAVIFGSVGGLTLWFFWQSYAPTRMVSGRPDVTPPRKLAESRKVARAMIPWPMVGTVLIVSALIFITNLDASDRGWLWWTLKIGSGLVFSTYAWVGLRKWQDRHF